MRYNYDDERRDFAGFGYQPPKPVSNTPEDGGLNARGDGSEAIGDDYVSGVIDNYTSQPEQPRLDYTATPAEPIAGEEPASEQQWREPSYKQTPETTTNMYSPGICSVQNSYSRRRDAETGRSGHNPEKTAGKKRGGFLRAACLALACILLSGAATYGVIEYRVRKGDFAPINQVILGGNNANTQSDSNIAASVSSSGEDMSAQDIYDMACSQVVGVKTEIENSSGFFGQQGTMTAVSGSGFIISGDGYILTNYHVIETAYENNLPLKIYLNDGTIFDAKIIGFESSNDVAVLKIDAAGLNAAAIANSDNIRVGQRLYAVGNPFGELVYTMTEGIISALDRVVTVENKSINTFQLSAAVNSGNSGGPVYDSRGEVIGIVTAKFMSSSVEGIGFAIPINNAIDIASELIENGYISGRAYMGITVKTVTSATAEYYEWVEGAYVFSVTPGSAADNAGLAVADIITRLGESEITSEDSLIYALRKFNAGDTTTLSVRRGGEDIELTITFDENMSAGRPQNQQSNQSQNPLPQVIPAP